MKRLVVIIGPTAIGKSHLSLSLAKTFDGEIVSADSRQVYRYMDIGTAKPTPQELSFIPHHLINIINPDQDFSLAQYQQLTFKAITDIQQRNKITLFTGGSGLYVWAVLEGWLIPKVPPDMEFRRSLEAKAAAGDSDEIYQELMQVDPTAARNIGQYNIRRLIRALEVCKYSDIPFSQLQNKQAPPFEYLVLGLTTDRTELHRRIDLRVDEMIEQGLVEEVKKLVEMGYGFNLPAMSSIGYQQIGMFLNGEITLEVAIQQIKTETHRFVRRQYNWFRLRDKRIQWFDIKDEVAPVVKNKITEFISG
ncbi:tRNA (adenosine(37)-N6)-dimethylallyltransferase MiaA [Chloroflexota bacterium]